MLLLPPLLKPPFPLEIAIVLSILVTYLKPGKKILESVTFQSTNKRWKS